MTNPQKKKKKTEIIEVWGRLKEKITVLLSDLDSLKVNKEQMMERYEGKLKDKNREIEEWGQEGKDMAERINQARRAIMTSSNVDRQKLLDILNRRG